MPEPVDAGESIAFSVAGTIGTYQGLIALRESGVPFVSVFTASEVRAEHLRQRK